MRAVIPPAFPARLAGTARLQISSAWMLDHTQPRHDCKRLTHNVMKKIIMVGVAMIALAAVSARADDAKAIYDKDCAKCHGTDGKGQTKMGQKLGVKDYTDAKVQAELKDDVAVKAIKEGLKDKEGKVLMKPAEALSD